MLPHDLRHFALDFLHTAELTFSAGRGGLFGEWALSLERPKEVPGERKCSFEQKRSNQWAN
jgi:hypothetical protein